MTRSAPHGITTVLDPVSAASTARAVDATLRRVPAQADERSYVGVRPRAGTSA